VSGLIWTVNVEFETHDDADALLQLLEELGIEGSLSYHKVKLNKPTPTRETRLGRFILRCMRLRGPKFIWAAEDLFRDVEGHGYQARSVTPILSKLHKEGDILRISTGRYVLK
jgi:hypothetical protein